MATWYYYNENGEKVGPFRGRELKKLARQGTITPETLIESEKGILLVAGNTENLTFPETPPASQDLAGPVPIGDRPARVESPFHPLTPNKPNETPECSTGNRASLLVAIVGLLLLLSVAIGIAYTIIADRNEEKLRETIVKSLNDTVIKGLPLEITDVSVAWTDKSTRELSGKFTAKTKTTENICQYVDKKEAQQKLSIVDFYEWEFEGSLKKNDNLSPQYKTAPPQNTNRLQFYNVLLQREGEVILTGNVELTKYDNHDWQVARFLVDSSETGNLLFDRKFLPGSKVQKGDHELDAQETKEIVEAILRDRKNFIDKVGEKNLEWQAAVGEEERRRQEEEARREQRQREEEEQRKQETALKQQKENFEKFCKPGTTYMGNFRAFGDTCNVRIDFEKYEQNSDTVVNGTIAFFYPGGEYKRPFSVVANTREIVEYPVTGRIDNTNLETNLDAFIRKLNTRPGPAQRQAVRNFFDVLGGYVLVKIRFTDRMEFSIDPPRGGGIPGGPPNLQLRFF